MSILTIFFSPFCLIFLINIIGLAIGKIRFKSTSLGAAGILFAGILIGFFANLLTEEIYSETISNTQTTMKIISKLGSSLFVSVIGLQTGFSIKNHSKSSMLAFVIGSIMSLSGVAVMLLLSLIDKSINYTFLLGILCGALTSTPGLSSVCELIGNGSESAVMGYGCSYLFGVILVVFFTQLFSKKYTDIPKPITPKQDINSKIYLELILVSLVAFLGNILGNIKTAHLSFGMTACTLMVGLLVGYGFKKTSKNKLISPQCLNAFRNLGLALFFVGTGFSTGYQNITFDIRAILYGILITLFVIVCGWGFCNLVERKCPLHHGFIIAGGMTSSPAYGVLSAVETEDFSNCFSFAYFGALISLILAIQIVGR